MSPTRRLIWDVTNQKVDSITLIVKWFISVIVIWLLESGCFEWGFFLLKRDYFVKKRLLFRQFIWNNITRSLWNYIRITGLLMLFVYKLYYACYCVLNKLSNSWRVGCCLHLIFTSKCTLHGEHLNNVHACFMTTAYTLLLYEKMERRIIDSFNLCYEFASRTNKSVGITTEPD